MTAAPAERLAWHGAEAVRLTSQALSVVVLPEHGAKIASLLHVTSGREWLAQPTGDLGPPSYGASFLDGEMCGWDELVPTIDACESPDTGAALPDHGEVWSLPWRVEQEGSGELTTSVDGRALSFRLRRRMTLEGSVLRLGYELQATGAVPLRLLWAAHPQLVCRPGTVVRLPATVRDVLVVYPGPAVHATWPAAGALAADLPRGTSRKLYVLPDAPVEAAELRDPDGTYLRFSWDSAAIPYLGIWLDHAEYSRETVAAVEPTTGFYDDLARAASSGRTTRIDPGRRLSWALQVEAGVEQDARCR